MTHAPQTTPQTKHQTTATPPLAVSHWLFIVTGFVGLTLLIGGLTRLTDSGLSITEWQPVLGIVPPLTAQDWQTVFAKYQAIPEFQLINYDFTLAEFKFIYWWEWAHRLIARLIGVVFLLPFLWFLYRRAIPPAFIRPLWALFVLGGLQGFMGWYMVQSGLAVRVDVSQYRLMLHFGLGLIIFMFGFWLALRVRYMAQGVQSPPYSCKAVFIPALLVALIFVQALSGALVAGLDAGKAYAEWPLLDGALVPDGLWRLSPFWLNLFENDLTAQFNHRLGAYVLFTLALAYALAVRHKTALWLLAALTAQAALGIITLLLAVPLGWGAVHQAGAVLALSVALIHLHNIRYEGSNNGG